MPDDAWLRTVTPEEIAHAIENFVARMIEQGNPYDSFGDRVENLYVHRAKFDLTRTLARLTDALPGPPVEGSEP